MRNRLFIKIFKLTLIYVVIFVTLQLIMQHQTSKYASFAEEQSRYVLGENYNFFSDFFCENISFAMCKLQAFGQDSACTIVQCIVKDLSFIRLANAQVNRFFAGHK